MFTDNQITATVENANMNTTGNQLIMSVGQGEEVYLTESAQMIESILADTDIYFTENPEYNTEELTAPINEGDEIGTVTYKYVYSHNSDDYLGYKSGEGDVQYFEYTAPLYAANSIDAVAVVTPEPSIAPTATPEDKTGFISDLDLWQISLIAIGVLFVALVILLIILAANNGGPNRRYPSDDSGRHSYDDRGGSRNRRRY